MSSAISIKLEDSEVKALLGRLHGLTSNLSPAFKAIGAELQSNIQQGFKTQSDPWGNKWQALSLNTRIMRANRQTKGKNYTKKGVTTRSFYNAMTGNMQILRDTSRLLSSINYQANANGVEVGTSDTLGKALMHQFGGTIKGRMFRGAKVPARPFLPIRNGKVDLPASWADDVKDILNTHIQKNIIKG